MWRGGSPGLLRSSGADVFFIAPVFGVWSRCSLLASGSSRSLSLLFVQVVRLFLGEGNSLDLIRKLILDDLHVGRVLPSRCLTSLG